MSAEGQGLLQLSQPPGHTELLMGKALLSKAGHAEGPTQPLLLKQPQENSMSSSVWGGRLHCFLQICFSLLISVYCFPRCPAAPCPGGCESSPVNIAQTGCTSPTASHALITTKSPYIPSLNPVPSAYRKVCICCTHGPEKTMVKRFPEHQLDQNRL